MKTSKYYVINNDLINEIDDYHNNGIMSEKLGKMILQIATNYANRGSFTSYTWKKDMINEAILTCCRYIHNFDKNKSEKPNAFAYITTICHNAFINYIRKQKTHSIIKDICHKKISLLNSNEFHNYKAINYENIKPNKEELKE